MPDSAINTHDSACMIAIIDYGMGNLRSVSKAMTYLDSPCKVCTTGKELAGADKIILPGVGAFGQAMKELKARGFLGPLSDVIKRKVKLLGICLGLQLFFEKSDENPGVKGLGIFKGSVKKFRAAKVKIPHMGWNDLRILKKHPVLEGITNGEYFYFVHSYCGKPSAKDLTLATCNYGRDDFAAVIGQDHIFATQFHPEKSQAAGLRILKNFTRW